MNSCPRKWTSPGPREIIPVARLTGITTRWGLGKKSRSRATGSSSPEFETHVGQGRLSQTAFKFKPEDDKRFLLRLNGVFYWATAYLNGAAAGGQRGILLSRPSTRSPGRLKKDNTLLVESDLPVRGGQTYNKRQVPGVFHHWDCLDPGPTPGGIWLPVEISSTGPARDHRPVVHAPLTWARTNARPASPGRHRNQGRCPVP